MKKRANINGVLNIYKKKGFTSFDIVALVRKYTGAKAGHTGTLDPDAEGVLPVCLGKATKLCDYLMNKSKVYIAGVKLGVETDTQDASGSILSRQDVNCTLADIEAVLKSFIPGYMQTPPMYSAIKINGKKLYELARSGIEIERKARPVQISNIELIDYNGKDELTIKVCCSKGTYIRSLAYDIGQKLGCGAHMSSLIRTKTGNFELEAAIKIEELKLLCETGRLNEALISIENALPEYKRVYAKPKADKFLRNGNPANTNLFESIALTNGEHVIVFDSSKKLRGIFEVNADAKNNEFTLKCLTMFSIGDE